MNYIFEERILIIMAEYLICITSGSTTDTNTGRHILFHNPSGLEMPFERYKKNRTWQMENSTAENFTDFGIASLIIYSSLIIAALIRTMILNFNWSIGIQAPLLLYGIFIGICSRLIGKSLLTGLPMQQSYNIYFIVVPIKLYRMCFCADLHGFKKNIFQTAVISGPGLVANAILVGISIRYFLAKSWNFLGCTIFGTACVAIYVRENVNRMRELGPQPQHIAILLEGETIIGTLMAFTLYNIFLSGHMIFLSTPYYVLFFVFRYFILGIFVGYIIGKINCFFFWTMSASILNMLVLSATTPLVAYYLCSYMIGTSGLLAISICGLMMDSERTILNQSSKILLREYWQIIDLIVDALILTVVGSIIGWRLVWYSDPLDYVYMVLIYCATFCGRFLIFILLAPLTSRLGYGMNFRGLILAVWGGTPSLLNICFTILPWHMDSTTEEIFPILFFYVSGMVIISLFLNIISMPYLLTFLRMDVIPATRERQLTLCMRQLNKVKTRALMSMRMESLMGETDWTRAESIPTLKNPHGREHKDSGTSEEDQFVSFCPDCQQEIYIRPSHTEYSKLKEAANMRILKTSETLQIEIFSEGLLSKTSFKVLNGIIRRAYDDPKNRLHIDNFLKRFQTKICCKKCQPKSSLTCFLKCNTHEDLIRPPNFFWRRICYHLMKSTAFHFVIGGALFFNMVFIITEFSLNPKPLAKEKFVFTFFDFVFLMIYTSECLVNVAGRSSKTFWKGGFPTYFRAPLKTFDFIILITVWLSFVGETLCYVTLASEQFLHQHRLWLAILKSVRMLRFIEFCVHVRKMTKWILQKYKERKLMVAYDIGKDFLIQEKKIIDFLPNLCEDYRMKKDFQEAIERLLYDVTQELHKVQESFRWIPVTIKTRYAAKLVINVMSNAIDNLMISGWIDNSDKAALISRLNSLKKLKSMNKIKDNDPKTIFGNVPWLRDFPETREALYKKVEMRQFESGKRIFQEGDKSDGIHIIITGTCDISYIPNEDNMIRFQAYGELPIVDNITSSTFEKAMSDNYALCGTTLGAFGFLTGRPYASNIICESPCETYFLSSAVIRDAMEIDSNPDNGLKCRLWKHVSKKLASKILLDASTSERTRLRNGTLNRFYMPELSHLEPCIVKEFIQDIVLIEGIVADFSTGKQYKAPCKIPRNVREIMFPENKVQARLVFVPRKEFEQCDISFQEVKNEEQLTMLEGSTHINYEFGKKEADNSAAIDETISVDTRITTSVYSSDSEYKEQKRTLEFGPTIYILKDENNEPNTK